jgi:hypothetical protein
MLAQLTTTSPSPVVASMIGVLSTELGDEDGVVEGDVLEDGDVESAADAVGSVDGDALGDVVGDVSTVCVGEMSGLTSGVSVPVAPPAGDRESLFDCLLQPASKIKMAVAMKSFWNCLRERNSDAMGVAPHLDDLSDLGNFGLFF